MAAVTLDDVRVAGGRIGSYVRRTPMMRVSALKNQPYDCNLTIKLECLQVTGSFKPRGAISKLLSLPEEAVKRGITTASGGNHGKAVAYLGWLKQTPATIYLSEGTPPEKEQAITSWGATAITKGSVWDESNQLCQEQAERDGLTYLHPFADPTVIAGQGTLALEVLEDLPEVDTLLVAIGGGGLISGISLAAKALKPDIRVIGVEPTGAPTLKRSKEAGAVITLPEITSKVGTLSPLKSAQITVDLISEFVDEIVLVSDEEMVQASRWLWSELNVAAELSGSAAVAALITGKVAVQHDENVCVLVCGAGADGIQ